MMLQTDTHIHTHINTWPLYQYHHHHDQILWLTHQGRCLNIYVGLLNHISSYFFRPFTLYLYSIRLPGTPARGVWTQAPSSMFLCSFLHPDTLSLLIPYLFYIASQDPSSPRKFPGCFSARDSLPPPNFCTECNLALSLCHFTTFNLFDF